MPTTPTARIALDDGGNENLTRDDIARATLTTPELSGNNHEVSVRINGRSYAVLVLTRAALSGKEPRNTNEAEICLRQLGFEEIHLRRRYDKETGKPLQFTQEQTKDTTL